MRVAELPTPALVVDADALAHNLDTMTAALPGAALRPHVKAHKCTTLARAPGRARPRRVHVRDAARDRRAWHAPVSATTCCSPTRPSTADRLRGHGRRSARASRSPSTPSRRSSRPRREPGSAKCSSTSTSACRAAAAAPEDAGALADVARARGLDGARRHGLRGPRRRARRPRRARRARPTSAMALLAGAHAAVGGDVDLRRRHRHVRHQHLARPRSRPARTR